MSTPDPALVAAAPMIDATLAALQVFIQTTFTGDLLGLPGRAANAELILVGTVGLQLPGILVAGQNLIGNQLGAGVAGLRAKLKAAITPPPA